MIIRHPSFYYKSSEHFSMECQTLVWRTINGRIDNAKLKFGTPTLKC